MSRPSVAVPELPAFQRYQLAFTAHIRDPKAQPRPKKVEARRMKVYTELLFNNVEGALLACFPVLRQVLGVRKWNRLAREFFAIHRCHTPYFRQIPDEFIEFLQAEWSHAADYPGFVLELAHYEWIELALAISDQETGPAGLDAQPDWLGRRPQCNPVMALLSYAYPVQRISARYQPAVAPGQPTQLLVLRDPSDQIRFIELNPVTARLLDLLTPGELSGQAALLQLAAEMQHPDPATLVCFGSDILRDLHAQHALTGTR
jgi:hypothetical protein